MTSAQDHALSLRRFLRPFQRVLGHARRRKWCPMYLRGLMAPLERKSLQPLAEHVAPGQYAQLHHFVTVSPWQDDQMGAVLARQAQRLVGGHDAVLIVDDTAFPKQGTGSVGVARQYCGVLGKVANCQVLVSLTLARNDIPVPLALRLFLPQAWTDDPQRCVAAGVPQGHRQFLTKKALALQEIDRVRQHGVTFKVVVADAGYGNSAAFRGALTARGLTWAVGVPGAQKVYSTKVGMLTERRSKTGRLLVPVPDEPRKSVAQVLHDLPPHKWVSRTWRKGTKGPLRARFAVLRVRVADGGELHDGSHLPGDEVWLVVERRPSGERKYYLTNHPANTAKIELIRDIKARWSCEQVHQQLKEELGLDHFEGRSWRGLHHHVLLCMMAMAFLQALRLPLGRRHLSTLPQTRKQVVSWLMKPQPHSSGRSPPPSRVKKLVHHT
ncbi:IS701 family transposase [Deinococcus aquaedulcis]|uniref:IS701 family transposase n=1 Tax=Deinococcus aquaedulcis TaxID=2840455 RepID=UPI0022A6DA5E|nr:IS701 family transposase [Deinococcus aquaedulcis]